MDRKLKVLAWSDCVFAPTGFGTVSRHVLAALHATGKYQIDQLAINYHGDFFDTAKYPYQISPAKLLDRSDPFGKVQLIRSLQRGDYDLLWVLNDPHIVSSVVPELEKLKKEKAARGAPVFKLIYYYPVDCTITPQASQMIGFADAAVTYTHWAKEQTLKRMPELITPPRVIYHGTDPQNFFPVGAATRSAVRAKYFRLPDPDTFLLINVNRNMARKDIPRTLLAYAEFRKHVPNCMLYLHTAMRDDDIDLLQCCRWLDLRVPSDVLFPVASSLSAGIPIQELNKLYNAADAFLTTTLGEGWGLTLTEAMATGAPVIAPNNSSIPEILGGDHNRGYVYSCNELIWVDNAGYRPVGSLQDILDKITECYMQRNASEQREIGSRAMQFVKDHSWDGICTQWVELVDEVLHQTPVKAS